MSGYLITRAAKINNAARDNAVSVGGASIINLKTYYRFIYVAVSGLCN